MSKKHNMQTEDLSSVKSASFGKVLQPLLGDAQDERMRMIVREELARMPAPKSPGLRKKQASIEYPLHPHMLSALSDEIQKIAQAKTANLSGTDGKPTTLGDIKTTLPRNTLTGASKYSKVHSDMSESPVAKHQPVLSPPPVRG